MLAWLLGIVTVLEMAGLVVVMIVGRAFASMGDGAPPPGTRTQEIGGIAEFTCMACIYVYFTLILLSCLPFMRGNRLRATGIIAHCAYALFSVPLLFEAIRSKGGIAVFVVFILPTFPLSAGWWMLYRQRRLAQMQLAE